MEYLECKSTETIKECPICGALPKHQDEWPESGTHAFTIPYNCGTEIDFPMGHDGATMGVSCDGKHERTVLDFTKLVKTLSPEDKAKIHELLK